ncbi:MAG: endonuclease/exonuclease/phosphatase family protein [Candidatus Sericytochromatia bacterium]|nr:endonuclease/exonuclease/phosphatase family protein [Candidatus Sericytochromatia bacterium]
MLYRLVILMVLTSLLGACGRPMGPVSPMPLAAYQQAMDPNFNPYLRQQIAQQAVASQTLTYHAGWDQQAFAGSPTSFNGQTSSNGFFSQSSQNEGFDNTFASTAPGNSPDFAYPGQAQPQLPAPQPSAGLRPSPFGPQQSGPRQGELKLLSYNVWGLPGPLGTRRSERFARLGATLAPYDVVTLQGAFSDDIDVLKRSSEFKYHMRHRNGSLTSLNSGLYTLSKYPVLTSDFQSFERCTGTDCLINKGVLMTRINHPQLGPVDIYTTHYQSNHTPVAERIRAEDNNLALQQLLERHSNDFPVIISGDFGFVPDQSEYRDLLQRLPLKDLYREKHPQQPGYTFDSANPYLKDAVPQRNNYLFYLPKNNWQLQLAEAQLTHREPVDGLVLSNQYGVAARLRLTQR